MAAPPPRCPPFEDILEPQDIAALAEYLQTPLGTDPEWQTEDIAETLWLDPDYTPANAPVFDADPLNITLVVETGDHHVSVLDGDTFEVLDRFETPFAVHGGPKFKPRGPVCVHHVARWLGAEIRHMVHCIRWAESGRA